MNDHNSNQIQIEISVDKLASLFNKGELCATDFSCLNAESKGVVRTLCLKSCAYNIQCSLLGSGQHLSPTTSTKVADTCFSRNCACPNTRETKRVNKTSL